MQEYVKISTDIQTTELLKQVSEAIESAIVESLNNIEIKESLETVINNQNEFPSFIERLKEQLIKINTEFEKVSEHNLSKIISEKEVNRNIIIDKIVTLFENSKKQAVTLSDIHLLQKEIKKNSEPIAEIKERAISNYDRLSEDIEGVVIIGNESSETLNKVLEELSNINKQVTFNNNEIKESLNLILTNQDSSIKRIKNIETIQNKPWYKKIIK